MESALPDHVGNKTECALLGFVLALGETYQVYRDEIPEEAYTKVFTFNSKRKSMSTVTPLAGGGYRVYTKGASEMVMSKCSSILGADAKLLPFGEDDQQDMLKNVIEPMASNGLRTIGMAYKDISSKGMLAFCCRLILFIIFLVVIVYLMFFVFDIPSEARMLLRIYIYSYIQERHSV